jgi:hypothetical protein
MPKLSPQTKTFIFLFCFAVIGTYVCLALWSNLAGRVSDRSNNTNAEVITKNTLGNTAAASVSPVDTSGWKTYSDKQNQISFLYKPDWKVLPAVSKNGFTVLQIDPGAKYYNIKIYISPKEFYIMDGVPSKTETIGSYKALNADDALYGIKTNNFYYTFDVGLSMSLVPDFDALVHSVKFGN